MARITASELLKKMQVENSSAHVDSMHNKAIQRGITIRDTVNAELRDIGLKADFADFTNQPTPKEALPILAKHISAEDMPSLEMGILARCFAQPDAHEYWELFKNKLESKKHLSDDDHFKQGLALALGQMCSTKEELADLYELVGNTLLGSVRALMIDKVIRANIPIFKGLFERMIEHDEIMRPELLSHSNYWKKNNPSVLEKWKNK